ncbi:hypothetical protein HNV12_06480 [Methanococcoides sp. SA1]|nr:hypothetical protein [Methanococcoides sp. SA1]
MAAENTKPETKETARPENNNTLKDSVDNVREESTFDAKAVADENRRLMSAGCKQKLDALAKVNEKFVKEPSFLYKGLDHVELGLGVMPGSYRIEGVKDPINDIHLPGTIWFGSQTDKKLKGRLPIRTAVALAHYLPKFLEENKEVVEYMATLEQDVKARRADVDVFNLGEG